MNIKYANLNLTPEEVAILDECPFEIINVESYLEYDRLQKLINKKSAYLSSVGEIIDLSTPTNALAGLIINLPDEEQIEIEKLAKMLRSLMTKSINKRRAALGEYEKNVETNALKNVLSVRKAELIEYFGKMFTLKEVFNIIKTEWKIPSVSKEQLTEFYGANTEAITEAINKYKSGVDDLRLTVKRSRIEELTWIYGQEKHKYQRNPSNLQAESLRKTLADIRKEVEGEIINIKGDINVNIQTDINRQLRDEIFKHLNIKEIILGRLASRGNINVAYLIKQLNDSHYAHLNTLINQIEDTEYEIVELPSDLTYDFNKIKKLYDQKQLEKTIEIVSEQKQTVIDSNVIDHKAQLLAMLKSGVQNLQDRKNVTDKR